MRRDCTRVHQGYPNAGLKVHMRSAELFFFCVCLSSFVPGTSQQTKQKTQRTYGGSSSETVRQHKVDVQQRPRVAQDGVGACPPAAVAHPHTQLRGEGGEANGV